MERRKINYQNMPLRQSFILTVFTTFAAVALLSGLAIWSCAAFRKWLLPDSNAVYLTLQAEDSDGDTQEFSSRILLNADKMTRFPILIKLEEDGKSVEEKLDPATLQVGITKAENSYAMLTPKRKLAYRCCGIFMIAVPAILSVAGILFCGFYFYRRKLYFPLKALSDATEQITDKKLDFQIAYESEDELGKLCRSFEQMRQALSENNRRLWKMIEERKLLQASIAHDLRNPIAILEGYTEYLQLHLRAGDVTPEKTEEAVNSIARAAKRLEQYTESVRTIDQLDDIEIHRVPVSAEKSLSDITDDLSLMVSDGGKTLHVSEPFPTGTIRLDSALLYRVLENIITNALRYAENTICLSFRLEHTLLLVSVADDGCGFPEEILKNRNRLLPTTEENGHCGMGLTISRLLCRKHGGRLELKNRKPHGALVKIFLEI